MLEGRMADVAMQKQRRTSRGTTCSGCTNILSSSSTATHREVLPLDFDHLLLKLEEITDTIVQAMAGRGFRLNGVVELRREKEIRVADELVSGGGEFSTREEDRSEIFKFLFGVSDNNVEFLCIDGSGLGKTELAANVFNHESVQTHFETRIWLGGNPGGRVCELIVAGATGPIIQYTSLPKRDKVLRESLYGKRYLVVLHESYVDYVEMLIESGPSGARGSRMLVTRDDYIDLRSGYDMFHLRSVSEEESWTLFQKSALAGREPKEFQLSIGKRIAESCQGLAVAAVMAIGAMLSIEDSEAEWRLFCENELPNIKNQRPFLKFTYDHLPSNLKQCFAYCGLFPMHHELDVQTLIKLWMAQGFIEAPLSSDCNDLEDIGYGYFLNLLRRGFLYGAKVDARGRVTKCRMHRWSHWISTFEAAKKPYDSDGLFGETIHHLSDSSLRSITVDGMFGESARSILFPIGLNDDQSDIFQSYHKKIWYWEIVISKCRFLRALDMHGSSIKTIPDSIGKLKCLRYLDLSENEKLTELPDSITELVNLQTLRLSSCSSLEKLPADSGNLLNLRHLQLDGCSSLTSLPRGFGQLTNLWTLSLFITHESHECFESMQKVRFLSLEWESRTPVSEDKKMRLKTDQFPHLEELSLKGCTDLSYMFALTSFPKNLLKLSLKRCNNCPILPQLDQCFNLRLLVLDEMMNLEYISENFAEKVCASLQQLWLTELPKLKGWCSQESKDFPPFSRLSKLVIEDCPNLTSVPVFPTLEEGLVLDCTSLEPFRWTMKHRGETKPEEASSSLSYSSSRPLSKLKNLCIVAIENFNDSKAKEIEWTTFMSLQMLKLDFLPQLKTLPEELRHVITLRELHIWRCGLMEIPDWIKELKFLEKLVIRVCPNLKKLPKEIKNLPSLKILEIEDCQTLLRRCEKEIGADWKKISNIPDLRLGRISGR